jgi:hypothetical protein
MEALRGKFCFTPLQILTWRLKLSKRLFGNFTILFQIVVGVGQKSYA